MSLGLFREFIFFNALHYFLFSINFYSISKSTNLLPNTSTIYLVRFFATFYIVYISLYVCFLINARIFLRCSKINTEKSVSRVTSNVISFTVKLYWETKKTKCLRELSFHSYSRIALHSKLYAVIIFVS
jgi:hypothetical protein